MSSEKSLFRVYKLFLAGLILLLVLAIIYQMTRIAPTYNTCIIVDVNYDTLELKVAPENQAWQNLVDMYFAGERKWVGGKLVEVDNPWGFTFDPETIIVAEVTAEALQTTLKQIKENKDYWFNIQGGICYVASTIFSIKES